MDVRCCISLALRVDVPVPRSARNPWIKSWKRISEVKRWFRSPVTVFQSTSTRPIPRKSLPPPFVTRTTIFHMLLPESVSNKNSACTMETTSSQFVTAVLFYLVTPQIYWQRCYTHMPDRPPERFRRSLRTSQAISSSSGTEYSTGRGVTPTGIGWTGKGIFLYSSYLSAITHSIVTLEGGTQ